MGPFNSIPQDSTMAIIFQMIIGAGTAIARKTPKVCRASANFVRKCPVVQVSSIMQVVV